MKIVIAPDSFKESLSAQGVAAAIQAGMQCVLKDAEYILLPVADGGEGTTDALVAATNGSFQQLLATGPLSNKLMATWGLLGNSNSAVIETAAASGLDLVPSEQRNPLVATSYGTGELIMAALEHGVEHIILGLGGSATNDGGVGLLQALGAKFLDASGNNISVGGAGLAELASIDLGALDPRLAQVRFEVACDVDNPLTGERGASAIFGPQKGADAQMVVQLDQNLAHFAAVLLRDTGIDISTAPGSGAAGGIGAAMLLMAQVELKSGVDIVLDAVQFESHLQGADLVITGEGQIDGQTASGKTPVGVARRAKHKGVPVIAVAGSLTAEADNVRSAGIDAIFSVVPGVTDLPSALRNASDNLTKTAANIARIWQLAANSK
ncbi:MAG: glycerate kinase [Pseudomonadales bacterium]|nr:glycerate kinase [Pseudomonadales bacterium]NRA14753.1 glycerate kinase [Oceanospirillaceae bacterium]